MPQPIESLIIEECKRRLIGESLPRIEKCLSHLSQEAIWTRPNPETVSVGNLILHLCGNVRQWILSGLGGASDYRHRQSEFDEEGPIAKSELLDRLRSTLAKAGAVMDSLSKEDLIGFHQVQGMKETGVAILIHVVEHFSYHTGQIGYFVKTRLGVDLGYYAGVDLNRKG